MESVQRYEAEMRPARARFVTESGLDRLLGTQMNPDVAHLGLVCFVAYGVGMTQHVEGWIRRAGQRCIDLGYAELGQALQKHAQAEADHHLMMIEDLRALTAVWNSEGRPPLDAEALLAAPLPASVLRYQRLHEEAISGPTPFVQIAIEYEIERLSVEHGPRALALLTDVLGESVQRSLSFLVDHVRLDVGHTQFNRRQMDAFLQDHPNALKPLVAAGTEALDSYAGFLRDCLTLAQDLASAPHR